MTGGFLGVSVGMAFILMYVHISAGRAWVQAVLSAGFVLAFGLFLVALVKG